MRKRLKLNQYMLSINTVDCSAVHFAVNYFIRIIEVYIKDKFMSLISIVIVLIVVGFLLWLVNTYIPMAAPIKTILNLVVIIAVVLWLLSAFGIISGVGNIKLK